MNFPTSHALSSGFINAADFGFSPEASGQENARALQAAVDGSGTVVVSASGTYKVSGTVYIGSHTSLLFGNNVFLQKVEEDGPFCHVLLNKGALTRSYDENITIHGLHIIVNGVDNREFEVYGLHGQIAFSYVKDLRIERFRCYDLGKAQFCIHICTFEDVVIDDVIIKGNKDGVHFGRGRRFTLRNGVFQTYDDAVALNAHDYSVSNPQMGWIEDGVIENCVDLPDGKPSMGYFCRLMAGAWVDWYEGMEVRRSDTVAAGGRLYRVQTEPDGTVYRSLTAPSHQSGQHTLDGIIWGMIQEDVTYTAGVRNVVFRDISLQKPRTGFSMHFDNDNFNRSYYPGAQVPLHEEIAFQNVRVLHDGTAPLLTVSAPVNLLTLSQVHLRNKGLSFYGHEPIDYGPTHLNLVGCTFKALGTMELVTNDVSDKRIFLKTTASVTLDDDFLPQVAAGKGEVRIDSDLTDLRVTHS